MTGAHICRCMHCGESPAEKQLHLDDYINLTAALRSENERLKRQQDVLLDTMARDHKFWDEDKVENERLRSALKVIAGLSQDEYGYRNSCEDHSAFAARTLADCDKEQG